MVRLVAWQYSHGMQRSRALGLSSILPVVLLACRMDNPAFGDDDELGDDSSESESESEGSGASESGSSSGTTTDSTTSDSTTTDSTTTSDSTDSTTTTSDSTTDTGVDCDPGLTDCEGICANLGTDPANCGECGAMCTEDELCDGSCVPLKYVFVSSAKRSGSMGGIGGADQLCNDLANVAGLPGTYFAWNSTELSYPNFDFVQEGVYRRTDGHIVATSYEDLTDGSLAMPINLDENQNPPLAVPLDGCINLTGAVWSNTTPLGEFAGIPNCNAWTSNGLLVKGMVGSLMAIDGKWSQVDDCELSCTTFLPIYCVQQDP